MSFKKKEIKKEEIKPSIILKIIYNNDRYVEFFQDYSPGESYISYYKSFCKWFYNKQSPYYKFKHKKGIDIMLRSEIKHILIYLADDA